MFYFWKTYKVPRIYERGLTACRYREIIEEVIPELMENVPLVLYNSVYFQQDGASVSQLCYFGDIFRR